MLNKTALLFCGTALVILSGCINSEDPEIALVPKPAAKASAAQPIPGPWKIHEGFESGMLDAHWTHYPLSAGSVSTEYAHKGTHSFKVTYSDFKYTFDKPIKDGKVSWWYLEGTGTPWSYMYILTDTSQVDLGAINLHVVTNFTDTYSFYHYSLGYRYGVPRLPGWHKFVANIKDGKITMSVDGQVGITVKIKAPVLAFQVAGAVIDDLRAKSE